MRTRNKKTVENEVQVNEKVLELKNVQLQLNRVLELVLSWVEYKKGILVMLSGDLGNVSVLVFFARNFTTINYCCGISCEI